jgi:diguanylate cyclase (GGDEF)-like protein/PAS domain S-box-containing protein
MLGVLMVLEQPQWWFKIALLTLLLTSAVLWRLVSRRPVLVRPGCEGGDAAAEQHDGTVDLHGLQKEIDSLRARNSAVRFEQEVLKRKLDLKEQFLEQTIQERTRELTEANAQLNQQISLRKTISDALVKSQTRLTQAIDASRLGLIDWDVRNGQFYQSAFHSLYGEREQSSEQVITTLKSIVHPDDYPELRDALNAALRGARTEYQVQYRVRDGAHWFWIEESGKVIDQGSSGQAERILGTRRNIQSEVLRDEQVRLAKSVFDHTSEGVFVLDINGRLLSVNPAFCSITGLQSKDLVGNSIYELSETPQKHDVFAQIFRELRSKGHWHGELLEKRHQGDYYPQWIQINAIFDERGRIQYFAGLMSDLSDRKAADEKLAWLLNYDELTRLANRAQFRDQMHRALVRYKDHQTAFALVLVDVDRFKRFNDSFGHEASDALLRQVAELLAGFSDRAEIVARIGGNEFACLVAREGTDHAHAQSFASDLFATLSQKHYLVQGHEVVLGFSIGVASCPDDATDIEALLRYGALAVQKAKYLGGNCMQTFDLSLKTFSRQRLELEQALRTALSEGGLQVFYQPKLDLRSGRITSMEALTRWEHPERGAIAPDEFVTIAEETAMIHELGAYVLRTACAQIRQWERQGFGRLNVAVNLSPRQLQDDTLEQSVRSIIDESGIAASQLELELTESTLMDDSERVIGKLDTLRRMGLKIAVDDFGTGYSSLSYLKHLPVDTLKIDRSFVTGMENSPEQKAIVKAIIVLASSLNMQVVAEGVENARQQTLLKAFGCNLVQGYLVSRPVDARGIETLLRSQCLEEIREP